MPKIKDNSLLIGALICALGAIVLAGWLGYKYKELEISKHSKHLTDSSIVYLHGKILDLPEELTAQKSGLLRYDIEGDTIKMGFPLQIPFVLDTITHYSLETGKVRIVKFGHIGTIHK